ncbi:PA2169 family four-helix-bundle protein [Sphingobacterium sp. SRCM116780]|uniref:PA2169 family four-helix-bundle protein n=1 Tax=Sphingobacterium sp. SRCM116780 TaxID=2907623 RepID=UPI001F3E50F9|nr:PA2169 family four-helix-bundle protein [Sphingobacterium sp. SRCM116780]UIR57365.1 PA2169 family four-helix-bundle protein [Sphingobacterium sp. SRCM116780]
MEKSIQQQADLVNDLIEINNDRIEGYNKAIELLSDPESSLVLDYFRRYRNQSEQFKTELKPFVYAAGEPTEEGTMASGKLFRMWMDIKNTMMNSTTQDILVDCEKGEDAFKKVYQQILEEAPELDGQIVEIINRQAAEQLEAHDQIKLLRDQIHPAL